MVSWQVREAAKQSRSRNQNEATALTPGVGCPEVDERSFWCECGDAQCSCSITLTLVEYELVREYATHFAVALNHENPESEHVVEEHERFATVEVITGEAAKLARTSDPRQRRRESWWVSSDRPEK